MRKGVVEQLKKIRRGFLWGENDGTSMLVEKLHLISWPKMCSSKKKEGMGLKKLEERNLAQHAKWWLIFHLKRDNRWVNFVMKKYKINFPFQPFNPQIPTSTMLKNIWFLNVNEKMRDWVSLNKFIWHIGDGKDIRFWKDKWFGDKPLLLTYKFLFEISLFKNDNLWSVLKK